MKVIAGPCVIENKEILETVAKELVNIIEDKDIDFYFKSSCVKDNRTLITGFRGVGFEKGIKYLLDIKKQFGCKITTDFHSVEDLERWGEYVDLIQIPAFLAKQTSIIKAAASLGKSIHIKKPQFIGPIEARSITLKAKHNNPNQEVIMTDRGTMLGYDRVFMDPRHIELMKDGNNAKVLVDCTHPNKNYPIRTTHNHIFTLAQSYISAGSDGIFFETHSRCNNAKCDSKTMLPLEYARQLIERSYELYTFINNRKTYQDVHSSGVQSTELLQPKLPILSSYNPSK